MFHLCLLFTTVSAFAPNAVTTLRISTATFASPNDQTNRRDVLQKSLSYGSLVAATLACPIPVVSSAAAKNGKSRTQGYAIQHTEAEWSDMLSSMQYFILRQGGTESPYSSILEGEERPGMNVCAGCGTPLFNASQKFHSGTGWPSYASPEKNKDGVSNVEMEDGKCVKWVSYLV